ncbi:MAG: helicase-related protein [Thaumarchaeota archaeon]|nr:helicase-related protein [Nitrososphaerota archaeon]
MSNESVIDNENVVLLDQLKTHLPNTTRASIAVGYFFISGFAAIMDSFARIEGSDDPDHVIRLMISPKTDRPTAEALLASNESLEDARRKVETDYMDGQAAAARQVRDSLGHMPQTAQDRLAVLKLADLIRRDKMQVRVYTKVQLHAKAYIFEMEDNKSLPRFSIVGSSNLSISGIREHTELNLRTNVDNDTEKLLEWFDRHWEEAAEFTEEMSDLIQDSWVSDRRPVDIYRKAVMHEYGSLPDTEMGGVESRQLFDFQKMAAQKAIKMLEEYGGVIVADVVGMGKSYIGSMMLKHLKETKRAKPLIICPPHLIGMWEEYMRAFAIHADVVSRYKIGMDDKILGRYTNCDVILVDESHNFRNKTRAYEALHAFMEQQSDDSSIIMLTATPISNGVTDLKNQLSLFPAERIRDIPPLGNASLDEHFKGLEREHQLTADGEEKIRDLLRHILIRRTRRQIRERYAKRDGSRYYLELESGERRYFPERNLTTPREYDIDKVYMNSFEAMLTNLERLTMARYSPGDYILEEYRDTTHPQYKKYNDLANSMKSLIGMVRSGLLKRMESSIAAFAASVENYRKGSQKFLDFLKDGTVPIGKDYQDAIYKSILYDDDEYDLEKDLGESDYSIDAFDVARWRADLEHDIGEFVEILKYLPDEKDYQRFDDKFDSLLEVIRGRDGKILLFTESRVTAEYLHRRIRTEVPDIRIGQIDSLKSSVEKREMVGRFDPANNNAQFEPAEELDMLVSTDVLSEGVNLQAGRTVINYDFHWNPVRLIQRVGRIDRIGSKHKTVDIVNFLPTTRVENRLGLRERVANKIKIIRRIIGHDQTILEPSEKIDEGAVIEIYAGVEDVLDTNSDGGILDMVQTTAELDAEAIQNDEDLMRKIMELPLGIKGSVGGGGGYSSPARQTSGCCATAG